MSDPNLELQLGSPQALVRRMNQQLDLVDRLLAEAEPAHALVSRSITNSLGMQMLWCPSGEFLMGSIDDDEENPFKSENQIQVQISQGFWLARTTVTQGQWQALMGNNPSAFRNSRDLPVENVNWHDAVEFCGKLNEMEMLPNGYHYALPTEAQWEYACRAGETGPYSGGALDDVAWHKGNSNLQTHGVGQKKGNAWGLHDMHGNVWEWCADWYAPTLKGGIDPAGPFSGEYRVGRGGAFLYTHCRASDRLWDRPGRSFQDMGFRPALVTRASIVG
jgi:formylglycine-generating enzyme required for sulfatase activity